MLMFIFPTFENPLELLPAFLQNLETVTWYVMFTGERLNLIALQPNFVLTHYVCLLIAI